MKENNRQYYFVVLSGLLIFYMLLYPKQITLSALEALKVWAEKIVPSLFPFMAAVNIFTSANVHVPAWLCFLSEHIFALNGNAFVSAFFSVAAGFPAGARTAYENIENGTLSKKNLNTYLCLSLNASPAFIMSSAAHGFLANGQAAFVLMFSTVTANLLASAIMSANSVADGKIFACGAADNGFSLFSSSVSSAAQTVISVGGYIIFFAVLSEILMLSGIIPFICGFFSLFGIDSAFIKGLLTGIFEMTNGIKNISLSSCNIGAKTVACAFLLSFGGFCVHFQALEFLKNTGTGITSIIKARLFCAVLSAVICFAVLKIFYSTSIPV